MSSPPTLPAETWKDIIEHFSYKDCVELQVMFHCFDGKITHLVEMRKKSLQPAMDQLLDVLSNVPTTKFANWDSQQRKHFLKRSIELGIAFAEMEKMRYEEGKLDRKRKKEDDGQLSNADIEREEYKSFTKALELLKDLLDKAAHKELYGIFEMRWRAAYLGDNS